MREDQVPLQRREVGLADPRLRQLSEAGVHAVDRAAFGNRPGDDGVAIVDSSPRRIAEANLHCLARNAPECCELDLAGHDIERRNTHGRLLLFLGAAGFAARRYI
jgi:hypothetical protein